MELIACLSEDQIITVVKKLLQSSNETIDILQKMFIQLVEKNIHHKVIQLLLSDSKIDPSQDNNNCIITTVKNGHTKMTQLLLNHHNVDPSVKNNRCIITAARYGYIEIVEILLQDKRVDPSDQNNAAICSAAENGHIEIVKLLTNHYKVNPSDRKNCPIILAAKNGHIEIVKFLLWSISDKNIYEAMYLAESNGHMEIAKLLQNMNNRDHPQKVQPESQSQSELSSRPPCNKTNQLGDTIDQFILKMDYHNIVNMNISRSDNTINITYKYS